MCVCGTRRRAEPRSKTGQRSSACAVAGSCWYEKKAGSGTSPAARELQEETSIEGHGLFHLCTLQLGSTIHHVFTTHVDDQEKPVARNEIVACKWVLRDKLSPAILNARAAELLSSQLPALTA
ncbi:NUDIX domain-containing protein [Pseudomonas juntendi]|uniref:NUDIX domain-containing protein n=1 Tax=Pseudomonas juntendi TaxID=2666183 RepID=UPI003132E667